MLKVWLMAARPKTLWVSVAPVVIGTAIAYADKKVCWEMALACLLFSLLIQVGTNFTNDCYDFKKGADTPNRLGPIRVMQAKLLNVRVMQRAIVFIFFLAFVVGIFLFWRAGWPLALICFFSIVSGFFYTAGPYPLGYYGFGDLFAFLFFGPIAVGATYYVQALSIHSYVLVSGIAPGLLSTAILSINNLRDVKEDSLTGKKTLAVYFGKTFVKAEFIFCFVVACLIPLVLFITERGHVYSLATVFVLPLAFPVIKVVCLQEDGALLNEALARAGKLLFVYALVFSFGWLL